jgi:hypothetical protein
MAAPAETTVQPADRTVGQVIADAIRTYQGRFWRSLALGVPPTAFTIGAVLLDDSARVVFVLTAGPLLLASSHVGAVVLVGTRKVGLGPGFLAAIIALLPLAASRAVIFPGIYIVALAWFAVFGLAVSVVLIEGRSLRESFRHALTLAGADLVHAVGTVAALAIVSLVSILALSSVLAAFGEQSLAVAAILAILVVSPIFFLGSALLYFDQVARQDEVRGRAVPRREPPPPGSL